MLQRKSDAYSVKITDFEGPLDLLLCLCKEQKLEIKTVPLASVTSQFLAYLGELGAIDMDLASEFLEVAATLVEIKARNILPKEKPEEEEDEIDPEIRLRAQLEEYKLIKDASDQLKEIENPNRFFKAEEPLKTKIKFVLDGLDLGSLLDAFANILHKVEPKLADIKKAKIRMDRFSVEDKVSEIQTLLRAKQKILFFDLFDLDFSKGEVINTFLAILELLKTGEIHAIQEDKFGNITIETKNIAKGA